MIKTRLGAAFLMFMLAACTAMAKDAKETTIAGTPMQSGFLGDYSQLKPVPDREGVLVYIDHSADYSGYTKVMFDPVEVYLNPKSEYKGVNPDVLKKMTDGFVAAFQSALTPGYEIVTTPGPDVLRVRAAITGVELVKTPTTATDFIPLKALFNAGRAAAGGSPRLAQMSAELEVLDPNGKRLAASTASRAGDKTLSQDAQVTWADMEAVANFWAKNFRRELDQLRKAAAPK